MSVRLLFHGVSKTSARFFEWPVSRQRKGTPRPRAASALVLALVVAMHLTAIPVPAATTDCATNWDNFDFNPGYIAEYTFQGQPIADHETRADPSNGGTAVEPDSIDLASGSPGLNPGPLPTPYFGYFNGGTVADPSPYDPEDPTTMEDDYIFFSMRVEADPTAADAFISRHWNVLLDIDNDGYKEYWVDLDGTVKNNGQADEVHIYYDNNNRQDIPDPKKNPQIEVATFTAWAAADDTGGCPDIGTAAEGVSHTRAYPVVGDADGDWIIEIQIPVTAFVDLNGNQVLYPDSPVAFVFSTSTSNTNPLQKDFMMDIDFLGLNDPITFGDVIIPNGRPQIDFTYEDMSSADYYLTGAPTGDSVYVTVVDRFANTSSTTLESIQVTVTDAVTGDDETVTLWETSPNSGQFTNQGGACAPTISPVVNPPTAWFYGGVDTSDTTLLDDWTLTYAAGSGTWTVASGVSGTQTATATAGTQYTSDGGEISFLLYENAPADGTVLTFCTEAADPLVTTTGASGDDDGQLYTASGHEITVSYTTGTGHPTPNLTVTDTADILEQCQAYIQFTRASGLPTDNFELGFDLLYVTVTLAEAAGDGSISVTLTGNDTETITLDETGPSSGVFRNTTGLPTQVDDGSPTAEDGLWEDIDEGVVTATYDYTCDGPQSRSTTATLFYIDAGGRVAFTNAAGTQDVTIYGNGQPIYVTVTDEGACDCSTPCPLIGGLRSFTVTVTSDAGDSETVTVVETFDGSGVFRNDETLTATTNTGSPVFDNSLLEADHNDLLTVTYYDCDDGDLDPPNNFKTDIARYNAPPLLVNTVLFRPDDSTCQTEAIELINVTSGTINATGFTLTDGDGWTYEIPQFQGANLVLDIGERIFVSLYPTDTSPTDFFSTSSGGTYYLFDLEGLSMPSTQLADADIATDSDQVMLYDSSYPDPTGIQDYVGWGLPPPPMNIDFNSDDSDAVFQSIWTDDAYRDVTSLAEGQSIERSTAGYDTDQPSDWQIGGSGTTDCDIITASLAFVSDFDAFRLDDGRVVVQWKTTSENGTLGFDLYRLENGHAHRVNGPVVVGVQAPQGGVYHVVDRHADELSSATYHLVEREYGIGWGREIDHGAFSVAIQPAPDNFVFDPVGRSVHVKAHGAPPEQASRLAAAKINRKSAKGNRRQHTGTALKIAVREDGLYKVPTDALSEVFSQPGQGSWGRAGNARLSLTHRGQQVAWMPAPDRSGLVFWGQAPESPYAVERIYWLREGSGTRISRKNPPVGRPTESAQWFTETMNFEQDLFPITALVRDPAGDFLAWDYLFANHPDHGRRMLTVELPDVASNDGRAQLVVRLHGATESGIVDEHHVEATLNGTAIGGSRWQGREAQEIVLEFDQSLLNNGNNELQLEAILDTSAPLSLVFLDSVTVTYTRLNMARDNQLVTRAEGHEWVTVRGFSGPDIIALDLSDPMTPQNVHKTKVYQEDSGWAIRFPAADNNGVFVAATPNAYRTPAAVWADVSSSLSDPENRADWVAIAPDVLLAAAGELAASRQTRGLETMVVALEDVFDEFNHGESGPEAIRAFLSHAYHYWSLPPRYALLIGKGTFDYRDAMGVGDNLVPPLLAASEEGLFSADALFGDVAGSDGQPEIAVGRLPVLNSTELAAYTKKLAAFERDPSSPWRNRLALVADDNPGGTDTFRLDSESMAALAHGVMDVEPIFLSELAPETARQALLEAFRGGAGLISYAGHGSLDRLADEPLLLSSDVAGLGNPDTPPVLVAWSCSINRFELPGIPSLGGLLVSDPDNGAVAVWAPSAYSNSDQVRWLGQEMFRSIFRDRHSTLGSAILETMNEYYDPVGSKSMTRHFILLGDPSVFFD